MYFCQVSASTWEQTTSNPSLFALLLQLMMSSVLGQIIKNKVPVIGSLEFLKNGKTFCFCALSIDVLHVQYKHNS